MAMIMNSLPLRTTSSGLYKHREDLGLHRVGYKEVNLHIWSPSLPSTPRRVQPGHGYSLRPSCLHSPLVRPMDNRPDARGPLSPGLPRKFLLITRKIMIPPPDSRDPSDGPPYFVKKCFPPNCWDPPATSSHARKCVRITGKKMICPHDC